MHRRGHLVCALATMLIGFVVSGPQLSASVFAEQRSSNHVAARGEASDVLVTSDGTITLDPKAPPSPMITEQRYQRFGTFLAKPQSLPSLFQRLQLDYTLTNPGSGLVLVDLRASLDGLRWSEWELDQRAGAIVHFLGPARYAQYRIKLFGNQAGVGITQIYLTAQGGVDYAAFDAAPVAPTYKVRATRMGMVGGRTANGHIITPRDHYVSLPSWRSLAERGGTEYMVRITYNGRTSVAPVWDVGPWNVHDDYWNQNRERFGDLPRGYPQDHAAYYDGYNKGMAEKGRVKFPTAVDVGDGVWLDDLNIRGDQATIEITFLWLGSDPLAAQLAPTAIPTSTPTEIPTTVPVTPTTSSTVVAAEQPPEVATVLPVPQAAPTEVPSVPIDLTIETDSALFKTLQAKVWYDAPKDCPSNRAHWTYTTPDPKAGENTARWQPTLPANGTYEVQIYVPNCAAKKARTTSAHYFVKHRDGQAEIVINQQTKGGQWVSLGSYPFVSGEDGFVELRDITGDTMQVLWYDTVKWIAIQ